MPWAAGLLPLIATPSSRNIPRRSWKRVFLWDSTPDAIPLELAPPAQRSLCTSSAGFPVYCATHSPHPVNDDSWPKATRESEPTRHGCAANRGRPTPVYPCAQPTVIQGGHPRGARSSRIPPPASPGESPPRDQNDEAWMRQLGRQLSRSSLNAPGAPPSPGAINPGGGCTRIIAGLPPKISGPVQQRCVFTRGQSGPGSRSWPKCDQKVALVPRQVKVAGPRPKLILYAAPAVRPRAQAQ
jgi:hypothetical protein